MRKVLVIDDEEALRSVVHATLGMQGYDVLEARDGLEGLEIARTQQPALILCDVHMDRMDGYAFVEELRKRPITAAIPVVLMTGVMKDYSNVRHAMEIGADDYLLKPFSIDDLVTAVRTRLQKQETMVQRAESRLSDLRVNIALSLPHELRTPLVAILGFSDILKADYESLNRKDIGEMAADIHDAATRLHKLIENFLIFAQIELMGADEAKVSALRRVRTSNLKSFIELLSRRKGEEHKRGGDLKLEVVEGSVAISSEYLERILSGLLDNAFKFSEAGTQVEVNCLIHEGWFRVTIVDHGRGMSPEEVSNVGGYMQFERKMYEQQGSGLGLIIAKRLLDLHGGTLTIESHLGFGTTLTAKLPTS